MNGLWGGPLSAEALVPAGLLSEAAVSGYHADNIAPALMGGFTLVRCCPHLGTLNLRRHIKRGRRVCSPPVQNPGLGSWQRINCSSSPDRNHMPNDRMRAFRFHSSIARHACVHACMRACVRGLGGGGGGGGIHCTSLSTKKNSFSN